MTIQISIGQVKRDISELVNRVAYQGERIVLTSRGRPKAVLVSLKDFEKLQQVEQGQILRTTWLSDAQKIATQIRERRGGQDIDVDTLYNASRRDLEERNG